MTSGAAARPWNHRNQIVRFISSASVRPCEFTTRTRATACAERDRTTQRVRSRGPPRLTRRRSPGSAQRRLIPRTAGSQAVKDGGRALGSPRCEASRPGYISKLFPPWSLWPHRGLWPSAHQHGHRAPTGPWCLPPAMSRLASRSTVCRAGVRDLRAVADWDRGWSGP
jgi:hypothetical protein